MPKTDYQKRKAAGQCVRSGCDRKPQVGKNGKRRSYCPVHNAENAKNSAAWIKRQKPTKVKAVRRKAAAPVNSEQAA